VGVENPTTPQAAIEQLNAADPRLTELGCRAQVEHGGRRRVRTLLTGSLFAPATMYPMIWKHKHKDFVTLSHSLSITVSPPRGSPAGLP
jgi:hypothetical protein